MGLSKKEKAAYSLGAVGKDMVYMLSASYMLYYYQDVLGVSAIAVGVILLVARIFDAFNDPIMGVIVAKTKTKYGRFRTWIFIGTLLNAVFLILLFAAPPALDGAGLVAYAAVIYIMWGVTYTMMDIPFWSMIPAFTREGKERESVSSLARSFAGVGSALITVLTVKLVELLGGGEERKGFAFLAIIVAILFFVFIFIMCKCVKEKSNVDIETPSVSEMLKSLVKNDQAMTVVIAIVLINCSLYITSNLVIYFFKYDFSINSSASWTSMYTIFNSVGGATQILSMLVLYPLLRKAFSAIKVFYISFGAAIAGYGVLFAILLIDSSNMVLLLVPGVIIFAAFGCLTVLTTVFLANTVDYGEWKNHHRDESVIFSMQTFVVKLASGVAAMAASITLSLANLAEDSSETVTTVASSDELMILRGTMTIIPIVGMIIAVIIFAKKYILTDEKMKEIASVIRPGGKSQKEAGE
ncbi:MAG: MFS transporter [Lachnospiraceae bacterium]|nr:MFS transporter [Lachnospiraceae bacterium]